MEKGPGARGLDWRLTLRWVQETSTIAELFSGDLPGLGLRRELGIKVPGAELERGWLGEMDEYGLDVGPERGLQERVGVGPGLRVGLYTAGEAAWGAFGNSAQLGRRASV